MFLLIVFFLHAEMLNVHAAVQLCEHVRTPLPCPATNLLWVGPALIILLADGRLLQLAWSGSVTAVGCVAPSPNCQLVGATPDALLLLREVGAGTGGPVAARQPAAATGELSKGGLGRPAV